MHAPRAHTHIYIYIYGTFVPVRWLLIALKVGANRDRPEVEMDGRLDRSTNWRAGQGRVFSFSLIFFFPFPVRGILSREHAINSLKSTPTKRGKIPTPLLSHASSGPTRFTRPLLSIIRNKQKKNGPSTLLRSATSNNLKRTQHLQK